ncbi:MAG TPA: DUF6600 domain-containing protein [Holophagaceae bacterium]
MNETFRNTRWLAAALLPAALLSAAPQTTVAPAASEDGSYQGENPDRYAMVRVLEGDVRIRKGDIDEDLSRGTPVSEGDVVESRGRGVLQLGDGTRIAFAGATRFTVAALFTTQKGEKQVLLRLDYGRLRVQLGGRSEARFRVDTPSGSATCVDDGSFSIEAERDRTTRLLVYSGHVAFANQRDQTTIAAGDRLTVYSPEDSLDRVRGFNTYDGDDFDRWSARALVVRRGESWDRVPAELRYYSDELDDHGHWVNTSEYGWVWQPDGVAEDWRPYYDGRWAPYAGGMTWISAEPWAYVAYHHGRWHWSVGVGWYWIPGVYYSPAWVAWNYSSGYCGWAPLGYYNTPCHWGYGAWGGGYCWNVVSVNYINVVNVRGRIYSDANVLRTFGGGTGGTGWTGGGRDLTPPWRRGPLMVSSTEFRNPGQIQSAFRPEIHRDRMMAYERQAQATTGRTVFRRDMAPPRDVDGRPGAVQAGPQRVPFENRPAPGQDRGVSSPRDRSFENRPATGQDRPAPSPRERGFESRPAPAPDRTAPAPRERGFESRPAPAPERREAPAPRERGFESRPAPAPERRYEAPAPRERGFESRPAPAPERRYEAPAPRDRGFESRPAPAPERREAPAPRERAPEPRPSGGEGRGREIRR